MVGTGVNSSELAASLAALSNAMEAEPMQVEESQPPTPDGTGRPVNFQTIAPGLYRSSYPQAPHFLELEKLNLKTIVTLVPQDLPEDYKKFMDKNNITHHHIPILANKDPEVYTTDEIVCKVLELMLDSANYPMLIHCNKGKHRTGCITASFRRVTGWTFDACIAEYERFSKPKDRALDKVFIERFNPLPLKPTAIERGYVGGIWRQPMLGSTNFSTYTTTTMETNYTATSDDSSLDYLERIKTDSEAMDERLYVEDKA
ncbi:tyrosine-protein phosphatase siw14 [Cladophialophora chaetospira]|uniref:diphosphoinositol-polyphosphate diphosphatase n=1 Tax=Cladophialophora chaetospira TaxID=386627 RepID=A0AA38XFF6_9EURO|nr:tyrosine-protein phosphatase siw14 [Cladophialophora chaetospira]